MISGLAKHGNCDVFHEQTHVRCAACKAAVQVGDPARRLRSLARPARGRTSCALRPPSTYHSRQPSFPHLSSARPLRRLALLLPQFSGCVTCFPRLPQPRNRAVLQPVPQCSTAWAMRRCRACSCSGGRQHSSATAMTETCARSAGASAAAQMPLSRGQAEAMRASRSQVVGAWATARRRRTWSSLALPTRGRSSTCVAMARLTMGWGLTSAAAAAWKGSKEFASGSSVANNDGQRCPCSQRGYRVEL